jgi:hypothetical protein
VKLVPANDAAGRSDRIVHEQARLAVPQMQLASGEAGRMTKQARHGMAHTIRVLDPFAKHHVAAALAVHQPALGEVREPAPEVLRRRQLTRMQLRITAGQPAHVAFFRRSLVGERGKHRYLGTRALPGLEQMRIDECERRVRGERDALSRRRQRCRAVRCVSLDPRGERGDVVEVQMLFRQVGEPIEATRQVVMLAGLDKAEMPLGQADGVIARQRAHDR